MHDAMQVDALALDLRPRSMLEASDLGVRLVQAHAGSVWRSIAPMYALVAALALSTVGIAYWLPALTLFWLKPWLDRSVLFVLSRAVFGESTRFADLWRNQRGVWWSQWVSTLTLRRLSPWRSFTQAAYQLEGQHGTALRRRRGQLLRGRRAYAAAMHLAFANVEMIFYVGVFALVAWMQPAGDAFDVFRMLAGTQGPTAALVAAAAYAVVVFMLEPFYVGAGFAMYLNRRVELEAWDIEQEFRRVFAA